MRILFSMFQRTLLGVSALLAMSSAAHAVVNNYGNLVGPNVSYLNITENTTQLPGPDPVKLFDTPVLAGDTATFSPLTFKANSANGDFQFVDGRLSADITPTAGASGNITSLSLTEGGGWSVGLGGTSASSVLARAALIINGIFITGINGASVNPIAVPVTMSFTNTLNGSATVSTSPNGIQFASTGSTGDGSWNGTATANFAGLVAAGSRITRVTLDLDNQLTASSVAPQSFAFIDKKLFNINATAVPEPATLVLAGFGGLGLVAVAYRKRKASKVA